MKTIFLILAALMSLSLTASENDFFKTKNLNFNYNDMKGTLNANHVSFSLDEQQMSENDIVGNITVYPEKIIFEKDGEEQVLPNNFHESISKIKKIEINSLNLDYTEKSSKGNFASLLFTNDGETIIKEVTYFCSKETSKNILDNVISSCINKGEIKAAKIILKNSLQKAFEKSLKGSNESIIENLVLKVDKGKFNLTCKYSLKIKASGTIEYRYEMIIITLKTIKAGWFSIKNRILKEIEKIEYDNVTITGDVIVIDLKES